MVFFILFHMVQCGRGLLSTIMDVGGWEDGCCYTYTCDHVYVYFLFFFMYFYCVLEVFFNLHILHSLGHINELDLDLEVGYLVVDDDVYYYHYHS